MTRRRLKPEELDLWKEVTRTAEALHKQQTFDPKLYAPKPQKKRETASRGGLTQAALDGKSPPKPAPRRVTTDLAPSLPDHFRKAPVQMDRRTFGRMSRGKLKPEARIDLHGKTLDRAHGALTAFILNAQAEGKRLVLVITGKGKDRDEGGPIPVRRGVLRHQVPQWLNMPPLAAVVMQVSPAHISHGGGGAYYVYLRRPR